MECLYLPDVDETAQIATPDESQRKHIRALRLKDNDNIMITNGKGLCFIARIYSNEAKNSILIIDNFIKNYGEETQQIDILVCNLADKNRMEWIVEKSTELGVSQIFIKYCKYSQASKVDLKRLNNKAISAIKQCKRSMLPNIKLLDEKNFINKNLISNYKSLILLDENGDNPNNTELSFPALIIVGPEGGFHPSELSSMDAVSNLIKWRLGNRRLRAETAVVSAISIAVSKI